MTAARTALATDGRDAAPAGQAGQARVSPLVAPVRAESGVRSRDRGLPATLRFESAPTGSRSPASVVAWRRGPVKRARLTV
jgi:hypothetical protein